MGNRRRPSRLAQLDLVVIGDADRHANTEMRIENRTPHDTSPNQIDMHETPSRIKLRRGWDGFLISARRRVVAIGREERLFWIEPMVDRGLEI